MLADKQHVFNISKLQILGLEIRSLWLLSCFFHLNSSINDFL